MSKSKSDESKINLEFIRSRKIFENLSDESRFNYFWVGCSDCGVPESEMTGVSQSEFFVHDNLANLVSPADINCLAAIEMAVDVHRVENIIVCGHYDCKSVMSAIKGSSLNLSGNWLRPVNKIAAKYENLLARLGDESQFLDCLCELNVIEQAVSACRTTVAADARKRGQSLTIHGVIYNPRDGLLRELNFSVGTGEDVSAKYEAAIENLKRRWIETDDRTGGK